MFSKIRSGVLVLAAVGCLLGASQASSIKLFAPTRVLARALRPCSPDLSSVSNNTMSLTTINGTHYVVSTVYVSTWCSGDTVNFNFENEATATNYSFPLQMFGNNQNVSGDEPYTVTGQYWDAYECGPLNCTDNKRILAT